MQNSFGGRVMQSSSAPGGLRGPDRTLGMPRPKILVLLASPLRAAQWDYTSGNCVQSFDSVPAPFSRTWSKTVTA